MNRDPFTRFDKPQPSDSSVITDEYCYEDEPIQLTAQQEKELTPKEYRQMRNLDFDHPFSRNNTAKIFYLQAKFMENFEDDYPREKLFFHYYPTYRDMTLPELRGYFTWRTKLRHGDLQKTSQSYAFVYLYELLHHIGSKDADEGFDKLVWFYEEYRKLDPSIETYARPWIIDYAVYYHVDTAKVAPYLNVEFDKDFSKLLHCQEVADDELDAAMRRLSSYHLDKSKCCKKYPEEMTAVLCKAYRAMDLQFQKAHHKPYIHKLYGNPAPTRCRLFPSAVFYPHEKAPTTEYQVSELQTYFCKDGVWYQNKPYLTAVPSKELGAFVRATDRLLRAYYRISPGLKYGDETSQMIECIRQAIQEVMEEKRLAAIPKVTFQLDLLDQIRQSADKIGEKLLTEEEREVAGTATMNSTSSALRVPASISPAFESASTAAASPIFTSDTALTDTAAAPSALADASTTLPSTEAATPPPYPLTGTELQFMKILLYGGDLPAFLQSTHLMSSILAEQINERFYDEFMDTVIEFDQDTPVIVEDYLEDLKGMIPE